MATMRGVTTFQRAASNAVAATSEMVRFRAPYLVPDKPVLARYGGRSRATVLAGDGIGPEMLSHVRRVFAFANVPVDFEELPLSPPKPGSDDDLDLDAAITSIRRNGVAIKGNVESKSDSAEHRSRNLELRRRLDLYANVLHCANVPGIPSRQKGIDLVIIRENTEGEYSGHEHETVPGVVESLKIVTRGNIERISRFAYEFAIRTGRKKVTAVHKANIQKLGDGLFLKVAREMAEKEYPQLRFESMIVDNASMQLVARPQQFDVMLMPNLYGNIISNIACGLVGGPGIVSGANVGEKYAVFETGTRNTGTQLAGKDAANPTAFLRASIDMLRYLDLDDAADLISDALFLTLTEDHLLTKDIGGDARTSDVVDGVLRRIEELLRHRGQARF